MQYLSPIDAHVHLRGEEYKDHDFLDLARGDVAAVGLCETIEMPNCTPWLTGAYAIDRRIRRTAAMAWPTPGIHVGLTNDLAQVRDALTLAMKGFCGLRSDKTFYTQSTGNMGIPCQDFQKRIWKEKTEMGYTKVSVGHFEDEKAFNGAFNPAKPKTHSLYRNAESEVIQVERQLRYAAEAGFEGTFYIAHCSNPETVKWVNGSHYSFRVVAEVTWHHLFLNTDDYKVHGNRVKMNPPLRSPKMQVELLGMVLSNPLNIIIGSDHAPHPLARKDDVAHPASGIPALLFWPKGIELLRKHGMSAQNVEWVTHHHARSLFGLFHATERVVSVEYEKIRPMWDRYGYNPFSRIDA